MDTRRGRKRAGLIKEREKGAIENAFLSSYFPHSAPLVVRWKRFRADVRTVCLSAGFFHYIGSGLLSQFSYSSFFRKPG